MTQLVCLQPGQLDEIMHIVIEKNRPEFVKLLIENGVSIKEFLTPKRLLQLYNNVRVTARELLAYK